MKTNKLLAVLSATAILATASTTVFADNEGEQPAMRDISTMELVRDMGVGINLGNTFESCGSWINNDSVQNYETAWGSPVITEDMIKGMADAGFGVVRIPVAWSNMMSDDYTINPDYIDRVKEVTSWVVENGMYAIVNIHYDGGWWTGFSKETTDDGSLNSTQCMEKYTSMWTQLCDAFGDYNDYVMFESLNEEGCWDNIWNHYTDFPASKKQTAYDILNTINQKFVDIVRNSGKNNEKRHLLIAGYGTDVDCTCDEAFRMPEDPENRCAVSVHYYTPSTFCVLDKDEDWGKAQTTWGTDEELEQLKNNMTKLYDTFIAKDVPVIIGEYGVAVKNKEIEQIRNFLETVCTKAYSAGMCPVMWDINYTEDQNLSIYNRGTCEINDSELADFYKNVADGRDVYRPGDEPEDSSSESISESESSTDSSAVDSSKNDSSSSAAASTSSKATSNATTSNPVTGAAQSFLALSAVAACALLVVKKRK